MISIVYVSQSRIDPGDRHRVLDDILTCATDYNTKVGISGLLIAAPQHFTQLLEGPDDTVEALMTNITADQRHTALRLVYRVPITRQRYPQWRMVRFDQGNFGTAIVDPLLMAVHCGKEPQASTRLNSLIYGFLHSGRPGSLL